MIYQKGVVMEGIRFVIDGKGKKTAVLIDLKKYSELWEDFYDSLIARLRANEPRESHKSVKIDCTGRASCVDYTISFIRSAIKSNRYLF